MRKSIEKLNFRRLSRWRGAMAAAGGLWDEARWEATEKTEEGKVKVDLLLAGVRKKGPLGKRNI